MPQPSHNIRLADIAAATGVSIMTVSKVLNQNAETTARVSDKTAKRIRDCASQLGYRPNMMARCLSGKSNNLIGVVLDSRVPTIYFERLSLMEKYATNHGYRFLIGQAHDNPQQLAEYAHTFLDSYGVSAILCLSHDYGNREAPCAFPQDKTVFLEQPAGLDNPCYVHIDIPHAFCKATEFLLNQGRQRIACLSHNIPFGTIALREQTYQDTLDRHGQSWRQIEHIPLEDALNLELILPIVKRLIYEQKADAIICVNDHLAATCLRALGLLGINIPQEVAVTGYNNLDFTAVLTPALTTFDDNRDLTAQYMIELCLELIHNPDLPPEKRSRIITPCMILRQST